MGSSMETVGQFGSQLPPGFRFHPTDQELIIHYLRMKVNTSQPPAPTIIADIDLYKFNPWELPEKAFFGEGEWFFFSPRDRKYPNGVRPNRATACGYWKATGTDKPIIADGDSQQCLGVKKTLVFYKGRPPKGTKTDWVMHEYRLLESMNPSQSQRTKGSMRLDDCVLCRVIKQKGNLAAGSDGLTELPSSHQINTVEQETKQQTAEEKSSPTEWTDQQLLDYLLGTCESTGESSDAGSLRSSDISFCSYSELFPVVQQDSAPQFVESALSSIKRKLSFSVLDELILTQPESKRQQLWVGEHLSPTESDSVNQDLGDFFNEFQGF